MVGGVNYGQGSSRDHAAMAPLYLGVKAILAKSYARIHHSNLINLGIMPLTFADAADWDTLEQGDELEIAGIHGALGSGGDVGSQESDQERDVPAYLQFHQTPGGDHPGRRAAQLHKEGREIGLMNP